MGSQSDWQIMSHTVETLEALNISYHAEIVSAHRTPDKLFQFAEHAEKNEFEVIIAGAGGAAHLPGMVSAKTSLPVLGVPVPSNMLNGVDSLLSIVQMPAGIPVGTLAIGKAGAINAALFAAAILGNKYVDVRQRLQAYRQEQTQKVLNNPNPQKDSL
ncbi:5-(carboxyamino)imidazole ribonucleotide mutase [Legionella waltersii]|nr:5-(carboxyamino)imidazole ribonucleotide mutase [Legionella waltersii]